MSLWLAFHHNFLHVFVTDKLMWAIVAVFVSANESAVLVTYSAGLSTLCQGGAHG